MFSKHLTYTPPKINMYPEKRDHFDTKWIIFQPSFFRVYDSFQGIDTSRGLHLDAPPVSGWAHDWGKWQALAMGDFCVPSENDVSLDFHIQLHIKYERWI